MLVFELSGYKQRLIFTDAVLSFLHRYRQVDRWQPESGGQLFAKITPRMVIVAAATGPHHRDFRRRFLFFPNKERLTAEIKKYFSKDLHYVGDWHTHPQKLPKPSWLDLLSMRKCFIQSRHELEHFILMIVGNSVGPRGYWVGLINNTQTINLWARG